MGAGVPLAAELKVTEVPAVTVWLEGCVVNDGATAVDPPVMVNVARIAPPEPPRAVELVAHNATE